MARGPPASSRRPPRLVSFRARPRKFQPDRSDARLSLPPLPLGGRARYKAPTIRQSASRGASQAAARATFETGRKAMARQFIYHMQGLSKAYPGARRSSRTSTCPSTRTPRSACSAPNGSGKSTLLRIMAGHRQGVHRRGLGRRGRPRRLSPAGAAARPAARTSRNVMEGVAARRRSSTATTTR